MDINIKYPLDSTKTTKKRSRPIEPNNLLSRIPMLLIAIPPSNDNNINNETIIFKLIEEFKSIIVSLSSLLT